MADGFTAVDLRGGMATFEGAASVEEGDGWLMPWRIEEKERGLYPADLLGPAAMAAGVRLSFRSDTQAVRLGVEPMTGDGNLDLVCDGQIAETLAFPAGATELAFAPIRAGEKLVEVYLPHVLPIKVRELLITDTASVAPLNDTRRRWITYGSSITHCGAAASPAQTWPALVARSRNLHLTCFGFGGQCHADPMIARLIRDLPADFISLKLGINIQGGATLGPRTFRAAVLGTVKIVREKHPDIPIALISPIISPPRETVDNIVGLSLTKMRAEIEEAAEALVAHGDPNLVYVSGLDIMGPDEVKHLPDDVHPDAEGYRVMARRFEEAVFSKIQT